MENKVSIIIPMYNAELFINECVKSCCNQIYKNIEIIVIDDGSNDDSIKIVKKINDDRIVIYEQENKGVSAARNLGLKMSTGNFITFLDADDWLDINCIKDAMNEINSNNLDIIMGAVRKKYVDNEKIYRIFSNKCEVYEKNSFDILINEMLSFCEKKDSRIRECLLSGSWCKIIRKDCISNIKFDEKLKFGEDIIFNIDCFYNINRFGISPNIWYNYRINDYSVTQKFNKNATVENELFLKRLKEKINQNNEFHYNTRVIIQFKEICKLYLMNKKNAESIVTRRRNFISVLNNEFWINFRKNKISNIIGIKYQIMFFTIKYKLYFTLYILLKLNSNI